MRNELTKRFFALCMIVFVLSFGLMLTAVNSYLTRRNLEELKGKALYTAAIANSVDEDLVTQLPYTGESRLTIVKPDGSVVFDNTIDPGSLENHGGREEIRQAFQTGEGMSVRNSVSLLEKTANYAVLLDNGDVLRVSMRQATIWRLLWNMATPMLAILGIIGVLSMVLASGFSRRIVGVIDRMDVENPDDRGIYDELKPFVRRLISQNQQIHSQMEQLREEHKKQDTLRREFTANVSHELKTPLTSISGFAEIIRDGMVKPDDIPRFAGNIYKEAQRLISLVSDILKLSHLEDIDERPDAERTQVGLHAVCEEVAGRLSIAAGTNGVTVTVEGEEVTILGVRPMLEEIIYNVCDNAIKYHRPEDAWVRITTGMRGGKPFVCVADNGIGIPNADQGRIFERFYRVNKSHSKEVGGTGLGLSIVKHGMAVHGGQVELHSVLGEGTEVTLLFN